MFLANPDRFLRFTRPLTPVLWVLAAVLLAVATWFSFTAPEDYQQGDTVRIAVSQIARNRAPQAAIITSSGVR